MSQRQETRKAGGTEETGTRVGIEGKGRFGVKGYSQKEPYRRTSVTIVEDRKKLNREATFKIKYKARSGKIQQILADMPRPPRTTSRTWRRKSGRRRALMRS